MTKPTNSERRQNKRINKWLVETGRKSKKKKKRKKKRKKQQYKTKEQYHKELKDPRWYKKRDKIIKRDEGLCRFCGSDQNLVVHHKEYLPNKKAWQYPDNLLVTLCNECHAKFHGF